jgi:hypothetical protein
VQHGEVVDEEHVAGARGNGDTVRIGCEMNHIKSLGLSGRHAGDRR